MSAEQKNHDKLQGQSLQKMKFSSNQSYDIPARQKSQGEVKASYVFDKSENILGNMKTCVITHEDKSF
jgi:hypothetical protein